MSTSTWSSLGSIAHLIDMMFPAIPRTAFHGNIPQQASTDTPTAEPIAASSKGALDSTPSPSKAPSKAAIVAVPFPREEFTDFQFWRVAPPLIVDDDESSAADTRMQDERGGAASQKGEERASVGGSSPRWGSSQGQQVSEPKENGQGDALQKRRSSSNLAWLGLGGRKLDSESESDEEESDVYESGSEHEHVDESGRYHSPFSSFTGLPE